MLLLFIFSAVKGLIDINHIENKSFCLHNICFVSMYIYYVYIYKYTNSKYLENIYMHLDIYIITFYII